MKTIFEWAGRLADFAAKIIMKLYPMSSTDNDIVIHIVQEPIIRPVADSMPDSSSSSQTHATEANTAPQRVYNVAFNNLGKHLTLNATISPETGCAEALSWVLLNSGYPIPTGGIPTVAGLTDWMIKQGFKEATDSAPGSIIVGRSPSEAHIGVCGKEWIMSNTSYDIPSLRLHAGKFEANYHLRGWTKVFPSTRFFTPC